MHRIGADWVGVLISLTVAPSPSPSVSPTPSRAPGVPGVDVGLIIHSVWQGVVSAVSASPWLGVILALAVLGGVVSFVRSVIHAGPRDPLRRFSRADKAEILARAGGRCEHHGWLGRCRETERLEADHIHPHSRGGWTRVANGQALCRRHNGEKRAFVPYDFQLRALEKRRAAYFPPGVPGRVDRRAPTRRRANQGT